MTGKQFKIDYSRILSDILFYNQKILKFFDLTNLQLIEDLWM